MTSAPDRLDEIAAALDVFEADDAPTLRALSMRDPLRNAPLVMRDAAGREREGVEPIEPGGWRYTGLMDLKTGLPPDCPVTPLGSFGDEFYFLNTLGQVHVMKAASFGKGPIEALFQGRTGYLEWAWPRWTAPRSKSDIPRVKGYEADECRMDLINACGFKGTFGLEDKVRGRGAWRGDDGGLILHAGNAILIDGTWVAPGEHGRHIYPARPRIGRPALSAARAGEKGEGARLLKALQSWNWARGELDARLMLGWQMSAMVGGALSQRPVAFVTGPEGTGKSLLQALTRALMQEGMVSSANTTAAAIYQKLGQDSLPVFADEMEAKEDTRATDRIIELARVSFSGDTLDRGGKEGRASTSRLMSSFLFSCIVAPPIDAQDASRRVALELRPRAADAPNVLEDLGFAAGGYIDLAKVGKLGAMLQRRWIDNWSRWDSLRKSYHGWLRDWGHVDRSADAFAPLLAACHLALRDDPPTEEDMEWWRGHMRAEVLEETAGREGTWERCLSHLLAAPSEALRSSNRVKSVGEVLADWRFSQQKHTDAGALRDEARDASRELERLGLALSFERGADHTYRFARLFVPIKSPQLHALYEGTAWAGRLGQPGPWIGALRQAPEHLWKPGVCDKGRLKPEKGVLIELSEALKGPSDEG